MADIISRKELEEQGYDAREIRRLVDSGRLLRIQRGFYVWAHSSPVERWQLLREMHRRRTHASVAGAHHPVVVSHASAAVLHGLPVPHSTFTQVHLVRPSRDTGVQTKGLRKTTAHIDQHDIVEIEGLSVTSLERTLVDLGRSLLERCAGLRDR